MEKQLTGQILGECSLTLVSQRNLANEEYVMLFITELKITIEKKQLLWLDDNCMSSRSLALIPMVLISSMSLFPPTQGGPTPHPSLEFLIHKQPELFQV